ncbi:MAG: hypothetical protein MSC31_12995 [Solirubrobacteraceae bacterium MAG38_C4-C5]|nr:hypothetical protein [Candidatus Siliceabacter maunaloa]
MPRTLTIPRAAQLAAALTALATIIALAFTLLPTAQAATSDRELVQRVKEAKAQATGETYVRFTGGMYEPTTGDVYVDGDPIVRRLEGNKLVAAPAPSGGDFGTQDACDGTYTHCETITCQSTRFYLNYYPTEDRFRDIYGDVYYNGEQADIRDDAGQGYRRYGPRGVRGRENGRWGFFSNSCLSGE